MCNSAAQSRHSQTTTRGASTQKKGDTFPAIFTASALCKRCNACTKNIPLYISPSVPSSRCMHSRSNINCFFIKEGPSSRAAPREFRYSDRKMILTSGADCTGGEKRGRAKQKNFQLSLRHSRIMPRQPQEVNVFCNLFNKLPCLSRSFCRGLSSHALTHKRKSVRAIVNWPSMAGPYLRIFLESGPRPCRLSQVFFAAKELPHSGLSGELFVFAPAGQVRTRCSWCGPPDCLSFELMTFEKEQPQTNRLVGLHWRAAPLLAREKRSLLARRRRPQT
jgi:hypothetical protein